MQLLSIHVEALNNVTMRCLFTINEGCFSLLTNNLREHYHYINTFPFSKVEGTSCFKSTYQYQNEFPKGKYNIFYLNIFEPPYFKFLLPLIWYMYFTDFSIDQSQTVKTVNLLQSTNHNPSIFLDSSSSACKSSLTYFCKSSIFFLWIRASSICIK